MLGALPIVVVICHPRVRFRPLPEAKDLEDLNQKLLTACEKDAQRIHGTHREVIQKRYEREKDRLIALPAYAFECCRVVGTEVNKFSQVQFETNSYSVPTRYAYQPVWIKAYEGEILVCHGEEVIARHPRCLQQHQEQVDPYHYLDLLAYKSRAVGQATAVKHFKLPALFYDYKRYLERRNPRRANREWILVIALARDYGMDKVLKAMERSIELGVFGHEVVKQFLWQGSKSEEVEPGPTQVPDQLACLDKPQGYENRLERYACLLQEEGARP